MTTHTPLARYSATKGALVSGFATAELHHLMGHDPSTRPWPRFCLDGKRVMRVQDLTMAENMSIQYNRLSWGASQLLKVYQAFTAS
ncbi:hypothetical protein NKI88_18550 [Mesorhizobium sp. M0317]|uniref:hypothetical protein n=1 Tax=Mesorhizobium sp. M0317 TaxID=2956935 RepID=UPI00333D9390